MRCRGDLIDLSGALGIAFVFVTLILTRCSNDQEIQAQEKAVFQRVDGLRHREELSDGEALVPEDEAENREVQRDSSRDADDEVWP